MSKLIKIATILAIAVLVVAAKQMSFTGTDGTAPSLAATPGSSISPADLTRGVGPLPETQVDSFF